MITREILDVTTIAPKQKHPAIFRCFDDLERGEVFVISNDHDPKPLYYQLLGERGNIFTWDYLEEGPEIWRVRIGKRPTNEAAETIGEIAASPAASVDYSNWEPDLLAELFIDTHHLYIKESAGIINDLARKVAQRHGAHHPELLVLAKGLSVFLQDMLNHMIREERILFPAIKEMAAKDRDKNLELTLPAGVVTESIRVIQTEHRIAGDDLKFFRKITHDYLLPKDACSSYAYLFEKLQEFEADLLQHIRVENNILFPKAANLEAKVSENRVRRNSGNGIYTAGL